jgi:hypothetical protein
MDKASSLFRVFDLAFFLPGAVLLVAAWRAGILPHGAEPGVRADVVDAVAAIGSVYVIGLCCHALARAVAWGSYLLAGGAHATPGLPWYRTVDENSRDIASYFWYLRSTCWNTAIALTAAAGIAAKHDSRPFEITLVACVLLSASAVLVLLGYEYDQALASASGTHVRGGGKRWRRILVAIGWWVIAGAIAFAIATVAVSSK